MKRARLIDSVDYSFLFSVHNFIQFLTYYYYFQDMNKLIEARNDILLGHVLSLVEGKKDNITRMFSTSNSDTKVLDLLTSLEGFKFKIKFLLTKANHMQVNSSFLIVRCG